MAEKLGNLQKTKQKNKLRLPILPKYFKFQTTYNLEYTHQKQERQENLSNVKPDEERD